MVTLPGVNISVTLEGTLDVMFYAACPRLLGEEYGAGKMGE